MNMNPAFIFKHINTIIQELDNIKDVFKIRHINRAFLYIFRTVPFEIIAEKVNSKHNKLQLLFVIYSWLPLQGSQLWLDQRRGSWKNPIYEILNVESSSTIGGSEISSVLGLNHYSKIRDLVERKCGLDVFNGSPATRWGKMMENVIHRYTECLFKVVIEETGSLPGLHNKDGVAVSSYSPDGLCTADKDNVFKILSAEPSWQSPSEWVNIPQKLNILFEFKCPYMRIPTTTIPAHYLSQPLKGQCVIPITDMGIFGDMALRKCKINDFGFNEKYDTWFHKSRSKFTDLPTVCGFVGVYNTDVIQFEEPIDINPKTKQEHIDEIVARVRMEISCPGSEYHYLDLPEWDRVHIPALTAIVWKVYNKDINIIHECVQVLSGRTIGENYIKQCVKIFNIMGEKYEIDAGRDFGSSYGDGGVSDFERLLERTADIDAMEDTGYRFYYSGEFYYSEKNKEFFETPDNLVDFTIPEPERAAKWLYRKTEQFKSWVESKSYGLIGIIPYKVMKIHYTPVWKDPEFLNNCEKQIFDVIDNINKINQLETEEDKQEYIDRIYPGPVKKNSKKVELEITNRPDSPPISGFTDLDFDSMV